MIQVENLSKAYGKQTIFKDASFSLGQGERLGLVGRNGSGKSTLFRILTNEEEKDDGMIRLPRNYRLGYLRQHAAFTKLTILDECAEALPTDEYGYKPIHRAQEFLSGLGFSQEDLDRPPSDFSGGYQLRLNLAKALLAEPNLLLLDEPTNYLDILSIRWLAKALQRWQGEFIIITHDRGFMDSVTNHTMSVYRNGFRKIRGNTMALYEQIAEEERIHEKTRQNQAAQRAHVEKFIARFRAKASKAKSVQSRVKQLEKMDVLEKRQDEKTLEFEFPSQPFTGKILAEVKALRFRYSDKSPEIIQDLSFTVTPRDRIAVIGKNGAGKSTLLNLLAGELQPTNGSLFIHDGARCGFFGQTNINRLNSAATIEEELINTDPEHRRYAARAAAGAMMFEGDNATKRISVLSGGERSRVLLAKLLLSRTNLLLLDEPTHHLDMESVESLTEAIEEYPGAVLLVTHDEDLIRDVATRLIVFDGGEATYFDGDYDLFLSKIGWKEEREQGGGRKAKANRRNRAELTKKIGPLKKEVERLESAIVAEEKSVEALRLSLEKASATSDYSAAQSLSQELKEKDETIERLFAELEDATQVLSEAEAELGS